MQSQSQSQSPQSPPPQPSPLLKSKSLVSMLLVTAPLASPPPVISTPPASPLLLSTPLASTPPLESLLEQPPQTSPPPPMHRQQPQLLALELVHTQTSSRISSVAPSTASTIMTVFSISVCFNLFASQRVGDLDCEWRIGGLVGNLCIHFPTTNLFCRANIPLCFSILYGKI